jgi:hypothetical protein
MNTPTTARRQIKKKGELRDAAIAALWDFSANRVSLNDSERLLQIKAGFSAELFQVVGITFDLQGRGLERHSQCINLHAQAAGANRNPSTLSRQSG